MLEQTFFRELSQLSGEVNPQITQEELLSQFQSLTKKTNMDPKAAMQIFAKAMNERNSKEEVQAFNGKYRKLCPDLILIDDIEDLQFDFLNGKAEGKEYGKAQQNHPYSTLSSGKNGTKRLNPNQQSTDSIVTDASQLSMEPTKLKRLDFGSLIADS